MTQLYTYNSVMYIYTHIYLYIIFRILFHYRLWQTIEYSSLCYIVGPGWLSVLYTLVYLC